MATETKCNQNYGKIRGIITIPVNSENVSVSGHKLRRYQRVKSLIEQGFNRESAESLIDKIYN